MLCNVSVQLPCFFLHFPAFCTKKHILTSACSMQHPNTGQNIQQTSAFYVQAGDELVTKLYRKMHYLSSPQKKISCCIDFSHNKEKKIHKRERLKKYHTQ